MMIDKRGKKYADREDILVFCMIKNILNKHVLSLLVDDSRCR